jgi:hypothetical protein
MAVNKFISLLLLLVSSLCAGQTVVGGNVSVAGTINLGVPGPMSAAALPASPLFGFTENSTAVNTFPTAVHYGMIRFWDSEPCMWPFLNPSLGVFNFSCIDGVLSTAYTNGVKEALYTLSRTPPWATSQPTNTTCGYEPPPNLGRGPGECVAPIDLNVDGSGTNAIWKAWITAIATHVNDPVWARTHTHIKYWEIWNEPHGTPFWQGSFAQLARMTEDANCIITGRGSVHPNGDGTSVPCTATPIDKTAQIVMSSGNPRSDRISFSQNSLYCSSPVGTQIPCPNPPNIVANNIDIVNFHIKPGVESGLSCPPPSTPCTIENATVMYVNNIKNILAPAEKLKPLWDGELSIGGNGGWPAPFTDPEIAASFFPRMYMIMWSLGVVGSEYYTWDAVITEPANVITAAKQTFDLMQGAFLTVPCTLSGDIWSCEILKDNSQYKIIWNPRACPSGICTVADKVVESKWTYYKDVTTTNNLLPIVNHTVPVGIKPLLLSSVFDNASCIPPHYCGYLGTDIVNAAATPPNLGLYTKNNAIVTDTSYVSHGFPTAQLSRIARCTDQFTMPTSGGNLKGSTAGLGGAGSAILWNVGSTLLHINSNGGNSSVIVRFDPVTMTCSGAITADKNIISPGSATALAPFANGQFDLTDPAIYYSWSGTVVTKYHINPVDGTFYSLGVLGDLGFGLPKGSLVSEWQPTTHYNLGDYVTHTMVPGEYFTWTGNTHYNAGDIIFPNACGYVATVSGTTGSTQPNFLCNANASVSVDGSTTWRSLAGPPVFLYQLVSASGTSGSSTPAFVPVNKHPDMMSQVTDGPLTWQNTGVDINTPIWSSVSRVGRDGTTFDRSFSLTTYGADPTSLGGSNNSCTYANCSGDQGTGVTVISFDSVANIYHLYNTSTLIWSDITCVGGTGYACTGGAFHITPIGPITSDICPFYLHDSYGSADGKKLILAVSSGYLGNSCPSSVPNIWLPYLPYNPKLSVSGQIAGMTHQAFGYDHVVAPTQTNSTYGFNSGAYVESIPYLNPYLMPPILWQATPCDVSGTWVPGDSIQPCTLILDGHWSWAFNPGTDDTPICSSVYNTTIVNTVGSDQPAPYTGEIVCHSTNYTWFDTNHPDPRQKQWRFGHTFATQSNSVFDIWFQIGQESQDGRFYAVGTDWGGRFGSTTGLSPTLPVNNPSVVCLGGYLWQANHTYTVGTVIEPVASLNGGGTPFHAFQAISVSGATGSGTPTWSGSTIGHQIVDGGVTWQDLGPGDCRGEVVIYELGKAQL